MKRRVIQLVLLLVAGAIVNVAVAWGCVIWSPKDRTSYQFGQSEQIEALWNRFGRSRFPTFRWKVAHTFEVTGIGYLQSGPSGHADYAAMYRDAGYVVTESVEQGVRKTTIDAQEEGVSPLLGSPGLLTILETRAGLPLRSLSGVQISPVAGWGNFRVEYVNAVKIKKPLPAQAYPHEWIPLEPIWLGFTANSIFYALLLASPMVMQRFIRKRRGLCPACAYPIGTSDVCTECGKTVKAQTTEMQTAEIV